MAPKKKKVPRNSFYFYMQHIKRDMEAQGRRFHGMGEVADVAGPLWSELTSEERKPFEEMARQERMRERDNLDNKYTTTGVSYAQLEREENEKRDRENKMKYEIENTVQTLEVPGGLIRHPFYFVHVNYYCRMENGTYIPCEIALARFTLNKGIDDTFHAIITQDEIPLGYNFEAQKTSDESHEIPLPPYCQGEADYYKLLRSIRAFIMVNHAGSFLPPVYTLSTHMDSVKSVLNTLLDSSVGDYLEPFRVYPLSHLFFELRNACSRYAETAGFPVMSLADRELDKDVFNFTPGISCDFHEHKDSVQYCSLSIVKRWCFLVADHSCQDVEVQLIPGAHVPLFSDTARNINLQKQQSLPSSSSPSVSSGAIPRQPSKGKNSTVTTTDRNKDSSSTKSARSYKTAVSTSGASGEPSGNVRSGRGPASVRSTGTTASGTSYSSMAGVRAVEDPFKPLRQPNTTSRAMAGVLANPAFTDDDFPPIGEQGGIYGRLPVVVAGRGRGVPRHGNPGRGRGLAVTLGAISLQ